MIIKLIWVAIALLSTLTLLYIGVKTGFIEGLLLGTIGVIAVVLVIAVIIVILLNIRKNTTKW